MARQDTAKPDLEEIVSFLDPAFFGFLGLFFLGAAILTGRTRLWFYTLMSYLFYSAAYPPYIVLLVVVSLINFYTGKALNLVRQPSMRRLILALGIGGSLSLLGYFKWM